MARITSIAGGAPKPVFDILGSRFFKQTGHELSALYDSMSGLASRLQASEVFDVLVVPLPLLEEHVKNGVVRPEGRAALANVGLAVGIKTGRKTPDISTPETLRHSLQNARTIVHAPPTATPSGAQSDKVIKELGLADALAGRVIHKVGLAGGLAAIASGEAELGIFPKSEIVGAEGIALAGMLPPSLQLNIRYSAGVTNVSENAEAAAAFIRFLITPESCAVWESAGFDPVARLL
jgi:molybdate transport system substrate-binding protein